MCVYVYLAFPFFDACYLLPLAVVSTKSQEGDEPPNKNRDKYIRIVTSLVVQWLRIHLPMQGTWFNPWLGNQDPIRCGASKPTVLN